MAARATSKDPLSRHLATLGVKPGASLDEVNTCYYTLVKRFPENPTEDDEIRMQGIRHAYAFLKRAYVPPARKPLAVMGRRALLPALIAATLLAAGSMVALNYQTLRLKMVHYRTGDLMRWKDKSEPYGQIVDFEARHQFPSGIPSAAYSIHLADRDETIWVSERLVVNGMVPATR